MTYHPIMGISIFIISLIIAYCYADSGLSHLAEYPVAFEISLPLKNLADTTSPHLFGAMRPVHQLIPANTPPLYPETTIVIECQS